MVKDKGMVCRMFDGIAAMSVKIITEEAWRTSKNKQNEEDFDEKRPYN